MVDKQAPQAQKQLSNVQNRGEGPLGFLGFLSEAVKHPRQVATAFPSSPYLAHAMADQVPFNEIDTVVELGAGDGALTTPLVERLPPKSKLFLVEVNPKFCSELRSRFSDHEKSSQIKVIEQKAQNLDTIRKNHGIEQVDAIVSGLPLTSLPGDLSDEILRQIYDCLRVGGTYVQFTYWTMTLINDFRHRIKPLFGKPRRDNVPLNLLPAVVYAVEKEGPQKRT